MQKEPSGGQKQCPVCFFQEYDCLQGRIQALKSAKDLLMKSLQT